MKESCCFPFLIYYSGYCGIDNSVESIWTVISVMDIPLLLSILTFFWPLHNFSQIKSPSPPTLPHVPLSSRKEYGNISENQGASYQVGGNPSYQWIRSCRRGWLWRLISFLCSMAIGWSSCWFATIGVSPKGADSGVCFNCGTWKQGGIDFLLVVVVFRWQLRLCL